MERSRLDGQEGRLNRLLVTYSADGLSLHTVDGVYVHASPAYADLLGYEPDDLVGRNVYEFIHPEDAGGAVQFHESVVGTDSWRSFVYRFRRADGTYRWVESASRLVRDEQVIVGATRAVDVRLSAMHALEAERTIATRMQDLDRQHRTFLTAVSHRARHPITIVKGIAELLARTGDRLDPARRRQLLERLAANADRLVEFLDDVTRAEGLARRAAKVQLRPVDLAALARERMDALSDDPAPIALDVAEGMVVLADRDLVAATLDVLLHNAIRHTPLGTAVWVRAASTERDVVLIVEDAGPGVATGLHEEIFRPFARGNADHPDPGLGLGLSVIDEIASLHRGRAWVQDREGGGASFRVSFPSVRASTGPVTDLDDPRLAAPERDAGSPVVGEATMDPTVRSTPEVLVVDDDPSIRTMLEMVLQAEGFDVRTASSGADALDAVFWQVPDVMVLDVMMPGMDGREVARALREDPRTRDLPIVVCSALSGDDARWQAWTAGVDSFVAKPFEIQHLLAELNRVLASRHASAP